MDVAGDLMNRAVVGLMLASAISGLLVYRLSPPHGVREFWRREPLGPRGLVFRFFLLLACWLLPFSCVALVLTGIPTVSGLLAGYPLELRLLLLFGSSSILWLLLFWYALKQAQP
jgi:hypothetical protein